MPKELAADNITDNSNEAPFSPDCRYPHPLSPSSSMTQLQIPIPNLTFGLIADITGQRRQKNSPYARQAEVNTINT